MNSKIGGVVLLIGGVFGGLVVWSEIDRRRLEVALVGKGGELIPYYLALGVCALLVGWGVYILWAKKSSQ